MLRRCAPYLESPEAVIMIGPGGKKAGEVNAMSGLKSRFAASFLTIGVFMEARKSGKS
ncbi:hypothetical protein D3C87_2147880 [compost metagenome]